MGSLRRWPHVPGGGDEHLGEGPQVAVVLLAGAANAISSEGGELVKEAVSVVPPILGTSAVALAPVVRKDNEVDSCCDDGGVTDVQVSDGRTRLTFADPLGQGDVADYLTVRVEAPDLLACRQVYAGSSEGFAHLARYFDSLAESWRGWPGERVFESAEGDLCLSATHDGHVRVSILLRESDKPRGWRVSAELHIEPGEQLSSIARDVSVLAGSR